MSYVAHVVKASESNLWFLTRSKLQDECSNLTRFQKKIKNNHSDSSQPETEGERHSCQKWRLCIIGNQSLWLYWGHNQMLLKAAVIPHNSPFILFSRHPPPLFVFYQSPGYIIPVSETEWVVTQDLWGWRVCWTVNSNRPLNQPSCLQRLQACILSSCPTSQPWLRGSGWN